MALVEKQTALEKFLDERKEGAQTMHPQGVLGRDIASRVELYRRYTCC
jgi:hypothetical protein